MDFKYKAYKNQVWDKDSLKRVLLRDYQGKTLQEALEHERVRIRALKQKTDPKASS